MMHKNEFFRVKIWKKKWLSRQSRENYVGSVGLPETQNLLPYDSHILLGTIQKIHYWACEGKGFTESVTNSGKDGSGVLTDGDVTTKK